MNVTFFSTHLRNLPNGRYANVVKLGEFLCSRHKTECLCVDEVAYSIHGVFWFCLNVVSDEDIIGRVLPLMTRTDLEKLGIKYVKMR